VIGLAMLFSLQAKAQNRIVIGTGLKPPLVFSETEAGFLDTLVGEAFGRLGIELRVLILPAGRVLANANLGIEDGCLLRIAGLEEKYPNLVRVPETLMVSEFVAYSSVRLDESDRLDKFRPLSVSYISGWQIFDKLFRDHPHVTQVKDADLMFNLLKNGRADVVLYERWQGLGILRELKIDDIHLVRPPLVSMDMFMYLHRRHRHLVQPLAGKLAELKQDGTYRRLYDRHLTALLP